MNMIRNGIYGKNVKKPEKKVRKSGEKLAYGHSSSIILRKACPPKKAS